MSDKKLVPISTRSPSLRGGNLPAEQNPLGPIWPVVALAGRLTELCEWVYRMPKCSPGMDQQQLEKLPLVDAPQIAELDRILTQRVTPEEAQALAVILVDSRGRAANESTPVKVAAMVHVMTAEGRHRRPISAEVMAAGVERLWFKPKATPFNGDIGELRAACETIREHVADAVQHARGAAEYRQRRAEGKRHEHVISRFYPLEDRDEDKEPGPAW